MALFGPLHLSLIAAIIVVAVVFARLCRTRRVPLRPVRLAFGTALAANEAVWYAFRYSREGFRFPEGLPLQLCDVTLWVIVLACLTARERAIEFGYFAGLAGAGMAVLTPDLWEPFPSYPAIYFFVAHGLMVAGIAVLVWGRTVPLRPGAMHRAFAMLVGYAAFAGSFNAIFGTNYMYLCRKPGGASLLDVFGPWPAYLLVGAAAGYALFWILSLPVRRAATIGS